MRSTVVLFDAIVYVPALLLFMRTWQGSRSKRTQVVLCSSSWQRENGLIWRLLIGDCATYSVIPTCTVISRLWALPV